MPKTKTIHQLAPSAERCGIGDYAIPLLFGVLALGISLLLYDRGFSSYDDGIAAEGARLVLCGKVPYRDFWALYAPGSYYANALALSVMGESMVAIRLVLPVLVFIQAAFLYGIVRRMAPNPAALAAATAAYLCLIPISIATTSPLTYWATATLAAAYLFVRWIEQPKPGWEFALGTMIGIGALFRQDGGAYTAAAMLPIVWLVARDRKLRPWPVIGRVYGSFALVLGLMAVYLASRSALGVFYRDTIRFAIFEFPGSRSEPYPLPWSPLRIIGDYFAPAPAAFVYQLMTFYVLPASLLVLVAIFIRRLIRGDATRLEMSAAALAFLALMLVLMVRARPSGARIVSTAILSLVVFSASALSTGRAVRIAGVALLACSILAYASFGAATVWAQRGYGTAMVGLKGGVFAAPGHAEMLTLTSLYIEQHTAPSEKILSGSPFIYFASSRDPATVYMEPHPCLTDMAPVQRRIIRDLKQHHVRYFVRSREWGEDAWFTIEPENQPRMLIDYIKRNFEPVRTIGRFDIFRREARE